MILTDEEIEKCRELAFHAAKKSQQSCKGQQVTPSDDYEYQFAWAIEAAILAKLNSAEPVAWMAPGKESLEFSRKDTVYGSHTIPLYLHPPAPSAPEGNDMSDLPAKAADEIDRLLELVGVLMHALHRVKYRACGEKHPHWSDSQSIFVSRGFIADVCDMALLKAEGK
jgi:hypothetical protein